MSDKTKFDIEPDPLANFDIEPELRETESETESEEVTSLRKSLEESKLEAQENWEKLLRKEAELQNVQRRASIDVNNARKFGAERMAQELLAVVDSFEQGLLYEKDDSKIKDGMQLTYTLLLEVLAKLGIKEINPAAAEAFDPSYHEAILMQDNKEMEPNKIIAVVQKGYFLHERVLRAARVIVSKAAVEG